MEVKKKIRVVWLCHFSNAFVHEKLDLKHNWLIGLLKRLLHRSVSTDVPDFANWITYGIQEMEKFDEVELHVVSPYPYLKSRTQEFVSNGVHYHFFKSEAESLISLLYRKLLRSKCCQYRKNCRTISGLIKKIHPEIVHLFGAENPDYATVVFYVPKDIIVIAQLQTLMNDPDFKKNYPINERSYMYRAKIEKEIILKADYIGTRALKFRNIIREAIKPSAIILNTNLALNEPIVMEECEKQYDFVYFAANISKAADLAIEAFALAYKKNPNITLDIIGGYDAGFKHNIDTIIVKYGIANAITFEGKLPSHDDVLKQIRKSRFALLPLKIDLASGSIREAMSNGLPVVTTDTGELGTQRLNLKRKNVLISPIGDHQALADNMITLMENGALVETLRQNSFVTRSEAMSNTMTVRRYVEAYKACVDNKKNSKPLPVEVTNV